MSKILGFLAIGAVLVVGSAAPASAEFFGCNEARTKVSYSSSAYRGHFAQAQATPRQRYASQPGRIHRRVASQWR